MEVDNNKPSPRDYLANERTFLAWIRTSIGIMAFGFVVVKFSFFLKQFSLMLDMQVSTSGEHHAHYSSRTGIMLVLLGMFVMVMSYVRYRVTNKQLDEGKYQHSSLYISFLSAVIFLISIVLVYYLIQA